jgi:hypothetical protein
LPEHLLIELADTGLVQRFDKPDTLRDCVLRDSSVLTLQQIKGRLRRLLKAAAQVFL